MTTHNTKKFYSICRQITEHATNSDCPLPMVVVTYQQSWLYARRGRVVAYEAKDMSLYVQFFISQEVAHHLEPTGMFLNRQEVNWWFLPPHIELIKENSSWIKQNLG